MIADAMIAVGFMSLVFSLCGFQCLVVVEPQHVVDELAVVLQAWHFALSAELATVDASHRSKSPWCATVTVSGARNMSPARFA